MNNKPNTICCDECLFHHEMEYMENCRVCEQDICAECLEDHEHTCADEHESDWVDDE